MNYAQTIEYLYTRLPMFSRIGAPALKPGLDNITRLCNSLGDPHKKFKSIHIAGTNGKGSVSHMLAAVFQTAGYKTGLHTSPHLYDFRERLKMNGEPAPEEFVIDFVENMKPMIEEMVPSFFEISIAMTFEYFAQQKVDIAIVETGLGGRLDSTNILKPVLSIITNIGHDHMQLLGNTTAEIAVEKAGIIKKNTPVVIGESEPVISAVFEKFSKELNATISYAQDQFSIVDYHNRIHSLEVEVAKKNYTDHFKYEIDLPGIYQLKNLLTVLQATSVLNQMDWKLDNEYVRKALANVRKLTGLHGRWEVIHEKPLVILDVAHNEDGMRMVLQQVEILAPTNIHIILGLVKDKAIDNILALLPASAKYYFTQAHVPRALSAELLQTQAATFQLIGEYFENVNDALKEALNHAGESDLILVCGSVLLVAEVRRF